MGHESAPRNNLSVAAPIPKQSCAVNSLRRGNSGKFTTLAPTAPNSAKQRIVVAIMLLPYFIIGVLVWQYRDWMLDVVEDLILHVIPGIALGLA